MNDELKKLKQLRLVSLLEGLSFLVLLGIAMPLKYLVEPSMPLPVRIVGSIHGALFIAFGIALFRVWRARKWSIVRAGLAMFAAVMPFGPFVLERYLKREEQSLSPSPSSPQ